MMADQLHARNHLLRLAQPLFWTLDELSPELDSVARLDTLQTEARVRMVTFANSCYSASMKADDVEAIRYCFCAAVDQAGTRIRGRADNCKGVWLQRSLLKEYYEENGSGQRCRAWIEQLSQNPKSHADALAVIAHLIERGLTDERGQPLPAIRLAQSQASPAFIAYGRSVVPHARPALTPVGRGHRTRWTLTLAAIVVIAVLTWMAYRQHADGQALATRVDQLSSEVAQRESADRQLQRWLALGIAAGYVSLGQRGDRVHLVFSSDLGFPSGKADVPPALARQLDQLAAMLASTDAQVTVVGHTDEALAPHGTQASNFALSESRAIAVGRYLQKRGIVSKRIAIIARGASDPVENNRTEAGKALNRRIEIIIDRTPEQAGARNFGRSQNSKEPP
ncbi:DotU family type IV/VI secretion system protein [Pandoraea sp. NPDC090278]|uniref:DotU family type IV/VI secretion system protein n=1 Tax=Pandoraea sp. NPDC090278 TaxID=3364391 RepID=UPI00383BE827